MYIQILKLTPKYLLFARPAMWWFKGRHSASLFLKTTAMVVHAKSVTAETLIKGRCEKKIPRKTVQFSAVVELIRVTFKWLRSCPIQILTQRFPTFSATHRCTYWLISDDGEKGKRVCVSFNHGFIPPKIRGVSFSPDKHLQVHFKCGSKVLEMLKLQAKPRVCTVFKASKTIILAQIWF